MTKPVGVPFNLPTHLRQCAEPGVATKPDEFVDRGDLLVGIGSERSLSMTKSECIREISRLTDEHNAKMRELGK